MLLPVWPTTARLAGTDGATLSLMADVVTLMAPLCAEALPALSRARTVKLYAVLADSPVLV